jgi:spermidine synthase
MNSFANRSERLLADWVCEELGAKKAPRILIGGLGMGCTLRAALDRLPEEGQVVVVELNQIVEKWCAGPLSGVNENALTDPRVRVVIDDASKSIRRYADDRSLPRLDAILLDLYAGPHSRTAPRRDPFYGDRAIDATRRALVDGGIFAIWSEAPDDGFRKRVVRNGFEIELRRAGRGGRRHAVYLARRRR